MTTQSALVSESELVLVRPSAPKEEVNSFVSDVKDDVQVLMTSHSTVTYVDSTGTKSGVLMRNITSVDLQKLVNGSIPSPTVEISEGLDFSNLTSGFGVNLQDVIEFRTDHLIPALDFEYKGLVSNAEVTYKFKHESGFKATQLYKWVGQRKTWCKLPDNKMMLINSDMIVGLDLGEPNTESKGDFFFVNVGFVDDFKKHFKVRSLVHKVGVKNIYQNKLPVILKSKLDNSGSPVTKNSNSVIVKGDEKIGKVFNAVLDYVFFDEKSKELEVMITEWGNLHPDIFSWTPKVYTSNNTKQSDNKSNQKKEDVLGYDDLLSLSDVVPEFKLIYNGKVEEFITTNTEDGQNMSVFDALVGYLYYSIYSNNGWKKLKDKLYVHVADTVYLVTKKELETKCDYFKPEEKVEKVKEQTKVNNQDLLDKLNEKDQIILALLNKNEALTLELEEYKYQELINKYQDAPKSGVDYILQMLDTNNQDVINCLKLGKTMIWDSKGNYLIDESQEFNELASETNQMRMKANMINFFLNEKRAYLEEGLVCFQD